MKPIIVGFAVFVAGVITLAAFIGPGVGAQASNGNGNGQSSPGNISGPNQIKESFSNEFILAAAQTGGDGPGPFEGVFAVANEQKGETGFGQFVHQTGNLVDCGGYLGFVGTLTAGSGPADVNIQANKGGTASGTMATDLYTVDDCAGTFDLTVSFSQALEIALTSDGSSFKFNESSCFPIPGGEVCTKDAARGGNGAGSIGVDGGTLPAYGSFGESKSSFTVRMK